MLKKKKTKKKKEQRQKKKKKKVGEKRPDYIQIHWAVENLKNLVIN